MISNQIKIGFLGCLPAVVFTMIGFIGNPAYCIVEDDSVVCPTDGSCSVVVSVAPSSGSLERDSDGDLVYTPNSEAEVDEFEVLAFSQESQQVEAISAIFVGGEILTDRSPVDMDSDELFVEGDEFDIGQLSFEIDPDSMNIVTNPLFGLLETNQNGELIYVPTVDSLVDEFQLTAFASGFDAPVNIVGTVIGGTIATEFSVVVGDSNFQVDIIGWGNLSESMVLPIADSGMWMLDSGGSRVNAAVIGGQIEEVNAFAWVNDNFLSYVLATPVTIINDWPEGWPTPPNSIPGGPWEWHPDPNNNRGGTLRPVNPPTGQSTPTLTWSPPTNDPREGNPNGYWKHNNGLGGTQRYSPSGQPITPAQAHPGRPGRNNPRRTTTSNNPGSSAGNAARGLGKLIIVLGVVHEVLDTVADAIEDDTTIIEAWWNNYEETPFILPGIVNPDGPLGGNPLYNGA
ncbi:MAG: hypothetical protein AAGA30_16815 [Planctomycetota bacterium]